MITPKYNIHEQVYLTWSNDTFSISEISIQPSRVEYKLWRQWTPDYHWFESWQMTKEKPATIWFKVN